MSERPIQPASPPPAPVGRDAAAGALADALAVSFGVLKWAMALLLVILLFSGMFRVQDNQVAIVLRLGQPVEEENQPKIYKPGLNFAFIAPIDEKIILPGPLAEQTLNIDSFWPALSPADKNKPFSEVTPSSEGLRPGVDGALLTGDENLVHVKLAFTYRIKDAAAYAAKLYDDPEVANQVLPPEKALLVGIIESATVEAAAARTADAIARSQAGLEDLIRQNAYAGLAKLGLAEAIEIVEVRIPEKAVPLQVRSAFEDVTKAENERRETMDAARREANNVLISTAGADWPALVEAITRYTRESSATEGDQPTTAIDAMLAQSSGKVAEILTQARTEATETVSDMNNKLRVFTQLLPEYRNNPAIVRQWLWADMVQTVLGSGDVEKTFLDPSVPAVLRLQGRDPTVGQQRELEAYKKRTEGKRSE